MRGVSGFVESTRVGSLFIYKFLVVCGRKHAPFMVHVGCDSKKRTWQKMTRGECVDDKSDIIRIQIFILKRDDWPCQRNQEESVLSLWTCSRCSSRIFWCPSGGEVTPIYRVYLIVIWNVVATDTQKWSIEVSWRIGAILNLDESPDQPGCDETTIDLIHC